MSKPALAAVSFATLSMLLISLLPAASAHGALAAREVDTRVLVDHDGVLGPAACHNAPPACDSQAKGLDLVSLDMRETHWVNATGPVPVGTPVVVFRVIVQDNIGTAEQAVEIHATAGGEERHFGFGSDAGGNYTSEECLALDGPAGVEGGDGAQQAFDCFVTYGALGVNATGAITAIVVHSEIAESPFDVMPGTWYVNDQLVPFVPEPDPADPTAVEGSTAQGAYNVTGPAQLLNVTASATAVDLRDGPQTVTILLQSALTNMSQVATLNATSFPGIDANLGATNAILNGGGDTNVTLVVESASRDGTVAIVITSDLGAYQVVLVAVKAKPAAPACPTGSVTGAPGSIPVVGNPSSHTQSASTAPTDCPSMSATSTESSGAPEMVFVAGLLAVLALARRRNS